MSDKGLSEVRRPHAAALAVSGYVIIAAAAAAAVFDVVIGRWYVAPVMVLVGVWMWGDVRKVHREWRAMRR